ncbi:MAG TPA: hypothetical protein PKA58_30240 [Polyangium sp.]|jgi:hypothetical protein|nr:hypothetical protein [Polyangium sp.]
MAEGSNRAPSRDGSGSSVFGAIIRSLVTLAAIGFSVACVYNVFGVGGEVEAMAKELACQGQPLPCTAQYTRAGRTPFSHTFTMYVSATSGEKQIECARQFIFVGDYSCKMEGGAFASASPAASSSAKSGGTSTTPARPSQKPKPSASSGSAVPAAASAAP